MQLNNHDSVQQIDLSSALFCEQLRRTQEAQAIADIALHLGQTAMHFAQIERVPRYDEVSRENDAEHSFMLSLVASEIAAQYYPELDTGLVSQFCTVHDLVELETGDVATFDLTDNELASKATDEHHALEKLCTRLPFHTASLLRRYEAQQEPEARLVRMIDKVLPVVVDIVGPGRKVMVEDYGVHTVDQLNAAESKLRQRFAHMFPEPQADQLRAARDILADKFAEQFTVDATSGHDRTA
jgi:5'-deoxynucleotidase YfbR-like HD superfamily hydrolase